MAFKSRRSDFLRQRGRIFRVRVAINCHLFWDGAYRCLALSVYVYTNPGLQNGKGYWLLWAFRDYGFSDPRCSEFITRTSLMH